MDLTNNQIKDAFKRQVRLCRGIGREEMLSIIDQDDWVGIKKPLPNDINLDKLGKLLRYSNKYDISIQFWTDQIAVYIQKDGVDLIDFGGDFEFAIGKSIKYLNRITKNK